MKKINKPWLVADNGQPRDELHNLAQQAEQLCRRELRRQFPNATIKCIRHDDLGCGPRGYCTAISNDEPQ